MNSARLVIFAPNWLGDAVMALPAMSAVEAGLPAGSVVVAARPAVAPLFQLAAPFARVVTLEGRDRGLAALRKGGYDTAILLPNSFNAARLAQRAGISERWGYRGDFRSWLLTRAIAQPVRVHQVEYYRALAAALGFPGGSDTPNLTATDELRAQGAALLRTEGWDLQAPLVAIAPGAAFGTAKRWPASSFAAVADSLAADGVRTAIVGSAGDRSAAAELAAAMRSPVRPLDLVGRTDLARLAGVLAHCRTLITNDSGAMHFAAALGVNVAVMFGPTRERETAPRGPGRQALFTHDVWCRPCMLRECPLTHRCMTGIAANEVHTAVRSLL